MKRSYIREILDAIDEETISFAGGLPNEAIFPVKALQESAQRVFKTPHSFQYSKSQGIESLREKIATFYTEQLDFHTTKEQILITTGSQQAFEVILKVFGKDEIVVQNPTYIGALSAFRNMGLAINSFSHTEELENIMDSSNDLYIMSDFINPTSKSLSAHQRSEIATTMKNKSGFMIEDGAYSFLSFDGTIQQPISAKVQRSFHLGSFSKMIAPGFRVGWIRSEQNYINKLLVAKESIDLHTPTMNQLIIEDFLENNDLVTHLKMVRSDYESRMEHMANCFEKYLPSFHFKRPKGGMFIYGSFQGLDSMKLAKQALEAKVAFVPAQSFMVNEQTSNKARFNFTNASFEMIEEGIKRLGKLVKHEEPTSQSMWWSLFQNVTTPEASMKRL